MTNSQKILLDLLSKQDALPLEWDKEFQFTSAELADLFLHVAFLITATKFLKEERWLKNENISQLFDAELAPIQFLKIILSNAPSSVAKVIGEKAEVIEASMLTSIKSRDYSEQKVFATCALNTMSLLFEDEYNLQLAKNAQGIFLGMSMYRTFDRLDELFNLDYTADHGMKKNLENAERLYEGAGVGVQSSYLTILTTLKKINLSTNTRFIDLGSGYGRVGLVIGLIRPDIEFIGYEFVGHRVDIANESCKNFGLEKKIKFYTQDLSLKEFKIPDAEVYYMYDPFSKETYEYILQQLVVISKKQKIIIVTKGNARDLLWDIGSENNWTQQQELGEGNLCIFESCFPVNKPGKI